MLNRLVTRFRRGNRVAEPTKLESDTIATPDEEEDSHEWDRPLEFIFSLISNSVGLGNVWRFPYLAARNGGGAFLIPYFILYFLIGAPLYYLELALGQFTSRGPATAFIIAKGWRGIGYAMTINSVLTMLYYNVIISWALFYFISSFRKNLLWKSCGNYWNDAKCFVPGAGNTPYVVNDTIYNCTKSQYDNATLELQYTNTSTYSCVVITSADIATSTEQFYYKLLLGRSESFEDFGVPQTFPAVALLVAWIVVGLCIIRGVKSSGKVAYFTAIFPYLVLLVLIIQSATLSGSIDGVKFYIIPKWDLVAKFETWQAASTQVFFSLGLAFGSLMAYSASSKFKNNFYKQMCIVVSCDCLTGIFAGFAVFSTIGFLAKELGEPVAKYAASSGPGLAFITYPEAISHMPASPFFAILFFLMLLALGLGSQFALTDVPITSLIELFPRFRTKRAYAVVITCVLSYLVSLPFTCPGGIYLFELMNEYAASLSLVVVGFFEVYTIAYIYGFNRFMNDVKMMLGKRAAQYYLFFTWCIAAPILMMIILISKLISAKPISLKSSAGYADYDFPQWSTIVGWILFVACFITIPVFYIYNYILEYRAIRFRQITKAIGVGNENRLLEGNDYLEKPTYLEAITQNNTPRADWGPKKRINHYGLYSHLNALHAKDDIPLNGIGRTQAVNETFQNDNTSNRSGTDTYTARF